MQRNRNQQGFTLIELMIALFLAAILSLMISRVSSQAQTVYEVTTTRVELYQKFRFAMADMKAQIENWRVTSDLEFFIDSGADASVGHWSQGEEIAGENNLSGGTSGYDEAAMIMERQYTVEGAPGIAGETAHDNFSIYIKSPVEIKGSQRIGNVEYYLSNPAEGIGSRVGDTVPFEQSTRLTLVKVVRWIDNDDVDAFFQNQRTVSKKVIELCQNVTDIKFEYYYDNLYDSRPGAFLTPVTEKLGDVVKPEVSPKTVGSAVIKEFMYGGFKPPFLRGEADPGQRNPRTGRFIPVRFRVGLAQAGVNFSELNYGDEIFIWRDSGRGQFPQGEYTVFQRANGQLEFQQPIDASTWYGRETGLRFKAGYVPSAVRITLRVLDDNGFKPRMIQLVVHPFRKKS